MKNQILSSSSILEKYYKGNLCGNSSSAKGSRWASSPRKRGKAAMMSRWGELYLAGQERAVSWGPEYTEMGVCSHSCPVSLTFQLHDGLCYKSPCNSPPAVWTHISQVCSEGSVSCNSVNICGVAALQQEVSGVLGVQQWLSDLQRPLLVVLAVESSLGRCRKAAPYHLAVNQGRPGHSKHSEGFRDPVFVLMPFLFAHLTLV